MPEGISLQKPDTMYWVQKKFNTKSAMNAHAINHQNKSFDCIDCSKSFTSPAYLKQHVQGKHRGDLY